MSAALHAIPSVRDKVSKEEWQIRTDLAATYRLVAHHGWADMIFTHISARVPGPEHHFLINPYGMLFDEITASSLVKIDVDGNKVMDSPYPVNPAGFTIHSAIHMAREDAQAVIHVHTADGVAVSCQEHGLLPISQHAMLVHDDVAYHDYEGVALDHDERPRLVNDLGTKNLMILRNHGTLTVGTNLRRRVLAPLQSGARLHDPSEGAGRRHEDQPAERRRPGKRRGPSFGHERQQRLCRQVGLAGPAAPARPQRHLTIATNSRRHTHEVWRRSAGPPAGRRSPHHGQRSVHRRHHACPARCTRCCCARRTPMRSCTKSTRWHAREAPGVLAVYTHKDLAAAGIKPIPCVALMPNKDGSPMFVPAALRAWRKTASAIWANRSPMVVAETAAQARDAAELIRVDYDELPAVVDTVARADRKADPPARRNRTSRSTTNWATRPRPTPPSPRPRTSRR